MKVIVASTNLVKLEAVQKAFVHYFVDHIEFHTCNAHSGVSNQPLTDQETFVGARNRANHACKQYPEADYWIGIEGGVEKINGEYEAFAWIVIKSKDYESRGKTGTFVLPKAVAKLIDDGKELGEADDMVFGMKDSKKGVGAVGILTKGNITRVKYYTEAVKLALIPFINKNHYKISPCTTLG